MQEVVVTGDAGGGEGSTYLERERESYPYIIREGS